MTIVIYNYHSLIVQATVCNIAAMQDGVFVIVSPSKSNSWKQGRRLLS